MALSGELSDLSLSELIEFFCNQRKTGRLKVIYPHLPGYFYIQAGALVDARIGTLSGIDAVYYALTLPNASFTFDMEIEVEQRTIHQPWTQVVLEGLRRMDEGISPEPPLNKDELPDENDLEEAFESVISHADQDPSAGPMAMTLESMAGGGSKRKMIFAAVAVIVLGLVAVGIITTNRFARAESTASIPPVAIENSANTTEDGAGSPTAPQIAEAEPSNQSAVENGAAAQMRDHEARDRERRRAAEERADARAATDAQTAPSTTPADAVKKPDAPKAGPKTVTVQVTYDEAGRVTQASGNDATALRIARQKRFPSGKAGTTTVTIPVN